MCLCGAGLKFLRLLRNYKLSWDLHCLSCPFSWVFLASIFCFVLIINFYLYFSYPFLFADPPIFIYTTRKSNWDLCDPTILSYKINLKIYTWSLYYCMIYLRGKKTIFRKTGFSWMKALAVTWMAKLQLVITFLKYWFWKTL